MYFNVLFRFSHRGNPGLFTSRRDETIAVYVILSQNNLTAPMVVELKFTVNNRSDCKYPSIKKGNREKIKKNITFGNEKKDITKVLFKTVANFLAI